MADVDQGRKPFHGSWIIHLERIVKRERIDVDYPRRESRFLHKRHPVLADLLLGGYQKDGHLQSLAVRVRDLEVELDVVHLERNMLLGFPGDDLSSLGLIHSVHPDELDDDIATAHARDDIPGRYVLLVKQGGEQLDNEPRLDDVTIDDRLRVDGTYRELLDLREIFPMIDHGHLDVAAPEIDANGLFLSAAA